MMKSNAGLPSTEYNAALLPQPVGIPNKYFNSLTAIMLLALAIRIIAAFFSKGFAYSDDHFDVIAVAQDWVYGLPVWLNEDLPPQHSIFYAGIHYGIFSLLQSLGFGPESKMLVVRLLHGLYSLLAVYFGYKITRALSNEQNARLVGLMLAFIWFMPFMSVRNLVEMVCIPPYLAAFYLLVRRPQNTSYWQYFSAGALFAFAFIFRYHTILFAGGVVLVLLYKMQWRAIIFFGLGFLALALLILGTIDYVFFSYPFESVVSYFAFNVNHAQEYSTGPIYRFLFTILGFMVPPVSVFLLVGYARTARLAPMLFWGGILFFVAHSLFPNKQERFILPLFPIIIILGVIGWQNFVRRSGYWQKHRKLLNAGWQFFWILNIIAAVAMAITYSKKSRIAPLVYLSEQQNLKGILLEFGNHSLKMPPLFYLNRLSGQAEEFIADPTKKWAPYKSGNPLPKNFVMVYSLNDKKPLAELKTEINTNYTPQYIVMVGQDELEKRLQRIRELYPALKRDRTIAPSWYDQVLHLLNPRVHHDEHVRIYQVLP